MVSSWSSTTLGQTPPDAQPVNFYSADIRAAEYSELHKRSGQSLRLAEDRKTATRPASLSGDGAWGRLLCCANKEDVQKMTPSGRPLPHPFDEEPFFFVNSWPYPNKYFTH